MKSPMVQNAEYVADKSGYTDMMVLRSPAGYYIGTMYNNIEPDGRVWQEPGSRDSDYFETEAAAQSELDLLNTLGDETAATLTRQHP